MCMVYQMDAAHSMSVLCKAKRQSRARSVAGPERKLDLLCSLSRPYCIGFSKSAAKIQNKNEIFLRSYEKVQILTFASENQQVRYLSAPANKQERTE